MRGYAQSLNRLAGAEHLDEFTRPDRALGRQVLGSHVPAVG